MSEEYYVCLSAMKRIKSVVITNLRKILDTISTTLSFQLSINGLQNIKKTILKQNLRTLLIYILCYYTTKKFFMCGSNYEDYVIPHKYLRYNLYKQVNQNLGYNKLFTKCTFSFEKNVTEPYTFMTKDFDANSVKNGTFIPDNCNPEFSVAILVTYRNRSEQKDVFLPYMHNFLRRQSIHYRIYLIEQQDNLPWNKGILCNVGAKQAIADGFPCLIFHDVDLLPLSDNNLYVCTKAPRHMSSIVDGFRLRLLYENLFGGVVSLTSAQLVSINGFSNRFDFWGGEDDEIRERIQERGLSFVRYPHNISRYKMLYHKRALRNPNPNAIRRENQRLCRQNDGLCHVHEHVQEVKVEGHPLYTLVGVKRTPLAYIAYRPLNKTIMSYLKAFIEYL